MVADTGADTVDINFGCPIKKVTKTGAGATLLDDPEQACRIVGAVAGAVEGPVSVKMRRGAEGGSRAGRAAARRSRTGVPNRGGGRRRGRGAGLGEDAPRARGRLPSLPLDRAKA